MPRWLGPDESVTIDSALIRRATAADAAAYSLADAQMVGQTYTYVMPPEFAQQRLAEVARLTEERKQSFADDLTTERAGSEPSRRTWVAVVRGEIVATCVSTGREQPWEQQQGVKQIAGITHQLNHLYVRSDQHGTGLAQALLAIALPDRMPAYLWLVGGNERAQRFYVRNGFVLDPVEYSCGPVWFHRPLRRMYRLA